MRSGGGVLLVVRSEIRGRTRSLVGIALIVALASAVVLTAFAGARRTESAFARFRADSRASDAWVQVNDHDAAPRVAAALGDLPMVTDTVGWVISPAAPTDAPSDTADFALIGDPAGGYGVEVDRPRIVAGRLPDPASTDEVLLSETAADALGLATGGHLVMQSFSPEDIAQLEGGDEFPGRNGPEVDLTVVGIGLWPEELGSRLQNSVLVGLVSPTFEHANAASVGSWPTSSRVRLAGGTDVDEFAAAVRELAGPDVEVIVDSAAADHIDAIQSAFDALAVAALVLGAICGLASLMIVGQAISRQLSTSAGTARTLGAVGMSTRERIAALAVPVVLAIVAGVAVGAGASVAASPLVPVGLARQAEPSPGLWVDPAVLLIGGLGLALAFAAWAGMAARRVVRVAADEGARRRSRSWIASRIARSGGGPVATTGVRFAYEPGAGRTAVPVRAAIAGGALGVAGVVAVAVVAVSLATLVSSPDHWGWTWSSRPDIYGEVEPALAAVQADDRIDAVAGLSYASVEVDGAQLQGYALESVKGSIGLTYLSGRAPAIATEVALGQRTLDDLGRAVGDTVEVPAAGRDGSMTLKVVGVAATPLVESTDPGRGAVLTVEGLDAVRQSGGSRQLLLRYRDGVDAAALESHLADDIGLGFPIYARPDPPNSIANLDQVQGVTILLAGFFVLLGAVGVAHALAVSVRRRRPELGVLRVLGLSRSQVRRTIGWQATTIAATSVVIGIPIGLVIGRGVWRELVGDLGVVADPGQPWGVLLAILPVSIAIALLAAFVPAHRAGRLSPAFALRSE